MGATPEERLGEPVLEKAVVQTTGTGRSMMLAGGIGGLVGVMANEALNAGRHGDLLGHKGRMFLLLGPTRLGFFKFGQGLLRASVGDTLGILRRDAVRSIAVGGGVVSASFTVSLDDGTTLTLEAPRSEKGKIQRIAALIAAQPAAAAPPPAGPPAV